MDIVFVDGKIAADRAAILIIKVKRINPYIKIMALAENETNKTRVLDYCADESSVLAVLNVLPRSWLLREFVDNKISPASDELDRK